MEDVWNEVIEELRPAFSIDMYEEDKFQTNLELFEEIYEHETKKLQAEIKQAPDVDLQLHRIDVRVR